MLTGVSDFAQSSSWIFENVTAEKTVSKVANINTITATTAFLPIVTRNIAAIHEEVKQKHSAASNLVSHPEPYLPQAVILP